MKFIHTGDLHIGGSRFLPNFLERQEEALDQIFDTAADAGVNTVVIAGDIFDVSDPSPEERDLVERKILDYDAAGYNILVIPGNHDLVDHSGYTALNYLSMLCKHERLSNSVIVDSTTYHQIDDTVFCLLFHNKGCFPEESRKAVIDFHESSIATGAKNFVMVAHETIRGSQTEIKLSTGDYYRMDTGESPPDPSLDVTYWALGDIHKMQRVGPCAYYPGSPLQTRFDGDWPKGVLLVDTDFPDSPEFIPIDTNQLVKAKIGDSVPSNAYVKLVLDSKSDLVSEDIPTNVVKYEVKKTLSSLSLDMSGSLKQLLIDGVKQQGAEGTVMDMALEEIESLLLSFQDV